MDLDLGTLISQATSTTDELSQAQQDVRDITGQLSSISQARIAAANDAAQAAQTVKGIDLTTKAQEQAIRARVAAAFGNDASKAGYVITQEADKVKVADQNLATLNDTITAKQSINFLSDPLGWIHAQLTVGQDIAQYNGFARARNRSLDTIEATESITQTAFQTQTQLGSAVTQAYIDASKIIAGYQYQAHGLEAAAQGARWNLEGIVQAAQLGKERLGVLFNVNGAQMQEKHYQTELQRLGMERERLNLSKQAAQDKVDEDALVLKYIQTGYFNLTQRQLDPVKAKEAMILFKAKQPDVMAWFDSGLQSHQISENGSKPVISLSPYKSSELFATKKVQNMSPAMADVATRLVEWRREFESPAVQAQSAIDAKDPHAKERAFNSFVESKKKLELANVATGSVFSPASMKQTAAVNKQIANLPVWKQVLQPAAAAGANIDDPNIAMGIISSAMAEGKLSYPDAVDISSVYQAGLELNNQSRNFIAMGISPVRTYNTAIDVKGQIGKTSVNLSDARAIATVLNKAEAARYTSGMTMGRSDRPFPIN